MWANGKISGRQIRPKSAAVAEPPKLRLKMLRFGNRIHFAQNSGRLKLHDSGRLSIYCILLLIASKSVLIYISRNHSSPFQTFPRTFLHYHTTNHQLNPRKIGSTSQLMHALPRLGLPKQEGLVSPLAVPVCIRLVDTRRSRIKSAHSQHFALARALVFSKPRLSCCLSQFVSSARTAVTLSFSAVRNV
ncbi:hypothetical protein WG66_003044, partial [Moniliophthora roreri]